MTFRNRWNRAHVDSPERQTLHMDRCWVYLLMIQGQTVRFIRRVFPWEKKPSCLMCVKYQSCTSVLVITSGPVFMHVKHSPLQPCHYLSDLVAHIFLKVCKSNRSQVRSLFLYDFFFNPPSLVLCHLVCLICLCFSTLWCFFLYTIPGAFLCCRDHVGNNHFHLPVLLHLFDDLYKHGNSDISISITIAY